MTLLEQLGASGVLPVIALEEAQSAERLGAALIAGGLPCAEITFRTAAAAESIEIMATRFPQMLVGAGTVLTVDQARTAVDRGARFLVTPGFDEAVVSWSIDAGVPIFPGIATPTEINMALRHGLHVVKFFPAEIMGGVKAVKALAAPYGEVRFIPTGGVTAQNLADYLRNPAVLACGGSWLATKGQIAAQDFDGISKLAAQAVQIVREVRSVER